MTLSRKTRFYTVNFKTYHRDRTCSYFSTDTQVKIMANKSMYSFMQYEPYPTGEPIKYQNKRVTGRVDEIELSCCPRCGK